MKKSSGYWIRRDKLFNGVKRWFQSQCKLLNIYENLKSDININFKWNLCLINLDLQKLFWGKRC